MPLDSLLQAFKFRSKTQPRKRLRLGVIGAGRMGQLHIRNAARHSGVTLAGIVETQTELGEHIARFYRTKSFVRIADLIGEIDAAIVAIPTPGHFEAGKQLLEAGIPCLIEKPIASSLAEAEALIALAEKRKTILQVGHIERFNPAVIEAAKHIDSPRFIEVNRLGPYDPRVADIGVVLDLMIHDLDIVLFLMKEPVSRVEAFGAKVLSNHEDIAKVRLTFASGCIADLSASRVSLKRYRTIRIFQKNAYLSLDYAAQKLRVYRKKSPVVKNLSDVEMLKPRLAKKQPLELELDHFIDCVREGKQPLVSGQHGRDALELAREVLEKLKVYE